MKYPQATHGHAIGAKALHLIYQAETDEEAGTSPWRGRYRPLRFPLRFRILIIMIRTEDEMSINVG
jgi:hypothetical protein